jgi:hypothetical protein
MRFQRAIKDNRSLFRKFTIRPPYKSINDIFCLRADRESGLSEVRFWYEDEFLGIQKVKNKLKIVSLI